MLKRGNVTLRDGEWDCDSNEISLWVSSVRWKKEEMSD